MRLDILAFYNDRRNLSANISQSILFYLHFEHSDDITWFGSEAKVHCIFGSFGVFTVILVGTSTNKDVDHSLMQKTVIAGISIQQQFPGPSEENL